MTHPEERASALANSILTSGSMEHDIAIILAHDEEIRRECTSRELFLQRRIKEAFDTLTYADEHDPDWSIVRHTAMWLKLDDVEAKRIMGRNEG